MNDGNGKVEFSETTFKLKDDNKNEGMWIMLRFSDPRTKLDSIKSFCSCKHLEVYHNGNYCMTVRGTTTDDAFSFQFDKMLNLSECSELRIKFLSLKKRDSFYIQTFSLACSSRSSSISLSTAPPTISHDHQLESLPSNLTTDDVKSKITASRVAPTLISSLEASSNFGDMQVFFQKLQMSVLSSIERLDNSVLSLSNRLDRLEVSVDSINSKLLLIESVEK